MCQNVNPPSPPQQKVDLRLVRVMMAVPPQPTSEDEQLPQLADRLAQLEAASPAPSDGEQQQQHLMPDPQYHQQLSGGSHQHAALKPGSSSYVSNLFGPRTEVLYLIDPYGSMTGPSTAISSSTNQRRPNPGAPRLTQLLAHCALQLTARPDPAPQPLGDPADEALLDPRVNTWREALRPLEQARAVAAAIAAQEREQLMESMEQEQWKQHQLWQQRQEEGQQEELDDQPQQQWDSQQQQQWPPAAPGTLDGSDPDGFAWMSQIPSAPQRDDAAEVARHQGGALVGGGGAVLFRGGVFIPPMRAQPLCNSRKPDANPQSTPTSPS
jgi:hypothetical protein